jgi:hypothetical protein
LRNYNADNLDRYARDESLLAQVTTNLTGIDLATPVTVSGTRIFCQNYYFWGKNNSNVNVVYITRAALEAARRSGPRGPAAG